MDEKKQKPQGNHEADEDFDEAPIIVVPKIKDTHGQNLEEDDDFDNPSAILAPRYSEDGHVSGEVFEKTIDVEATLKANKEAAKAKREAEAEAKEEESQKDGDTPEKITVGEGIQAFLGAIIFFTFLYYVLHFIYPETINISFLNFWADDTAIEQVDQTKKADQTEQAEPAQEKSTETEKPTSKKKGPYKIDYKGLSFSSSEEIKEFSPLDTHDGSGIETHYYIKKGKILISDFYYSGMLRAVNDLAALSDKQLKHYYTENNIFTSIDNVKRSGDVICVSGYNGTPDDMYVYLIIDADKKCVHQILIGCSDDDVVNTPETQRLLKEVKKSFTYNDMKLAK